MLDRCPALVRLAELAEKQRMPQSLLLVGPEGSGKEAAAIELAVKLLRPAAMPSLGENSLFGDLPATAPAPDAAERKVRQLAHPDLFVTFPVESKLTRDGYRALLDEKAAEPLARVRQPSSAIIPIGDADDPGLVSVRAIRRFVQAVPFEAPHRVVIIGDAHRMNRSAANALLKTLEEPPSSAVLILCTHQAHLLPATVRSRCARLQVPALTEAELATYLQLRAEVDTADAARIAAVAGGNARRSFDLLDPRARELAVWASQLLEMMLDSDRVHLARAAERVGKAQAPIGKASKFAGDASLNVGRDIGVRVLDMMAADLVALARRDSGARLDVSRAMSMPTATVDPSRAMRAVELILDARTDLSRNVNVGLVMVHGLLQAESVLQGRFAALAN